MELLGDVGVWNLVSVYLETMLMSVRLEIVLMLTLDRCTVCTLRTIGLNIILDAPDGTPRDMGQLESCFILFGDSVNVGT
jgi:hypothetical protein